MIQLHKHQPLAPPRIIVYGPPGVGKTTFASMAPNPVFLPFEDGLGLIAASAITTTSRRVIASVEDTESALQGLLLNEHDFQTVVIDSLTSFQALVFEKVTNSAGVDDINSGVLSWGVGTGTAIKHIRSLFRSLDMLREKRSMAIVCLAHATVGVTDDPEGDPYPRTELRLQHGKNHSIRAMAREWADGVYYADLVKHLTKDGKGASAKTKAIDGKGERILRCKPHASRDGKDRNGLPQTLPLEWAAFEAAYRAAAAASAPPTTEPDEDSETQATEPEPETTNESSTP